MSLLRACPLIRLVRLAYVCDIQAQLGHSAIYLCSQLTLEKPGCLFEQARHTVQCAVNFVGPRSHISLIGHSNNMPYLAQQLVVMDITFLDKEDLREEILL